jgi:hypothetical protein
MRTFGLWPGISGATVKELKITASVVSESEALKQ